MLVYQPVIREIVIRIARLVYLVAAEINSEGSFHWFKQETVENEIIYFVLSRKSS